MVIDARGRGRQEVGRRLEDGRKVERERNRGKGETEKPAFNLRSRARKTFGFSSI